jgi:hypothetical protein
MTTMVTFLNHGPADVKVTVVDSKTRVASATERPLLIKPGKFEHGMYVHLNQSFLLEETFESSNG